MPEIIHLNNKPPEDESLIGKEASTFKTKNILSGEFEIYMDGLPFMKHAIIPKGLFSDVKATLPSVQFSDTNRLGYVHRESFVYEDIRKMGAETTFGARKRNAMYHLPAGPCKSNTEYPKLYGRLIDMAHYVSEQYKDFAPDIYAIHQEFSSAIRLGYKLGKSPFTSAIVNQNNRLNFHTDRNNFKNVFSNMVVFKTKSLGGNLMVPSLDVEVKLQDRSLLIFDGQSLVHGVTPISNLGKDSSRYSIVFYALESLTKAGNIEEEIQKTRDSEEYKHRKYMAHVKGLKK